MRILLLIPALMILQAAPTLRRQPVPQPDNRPLEKSAYLAYVDREFIFTIEAVSSGVFIFNFVSMVDTQVNLLAKQVRLALENRKAAVEYFTVDTGNPGEPVVLPAVRIRPRSSFGVRLHGTFEKERELFGAAVMIGTQDLNLVPLASFDFENLVLKVNRINLESPDFRDDWRVLKLESLGTRSRASRR